MVATPVHIGSIVGLTRVLLFAGLPLVVAFLHRLRWLSGLRVRLRCLLLCHKGLFDHS